MSLRCRLVMTKLCDLIRFDLKGERGLHVMSRFACIVHVEVNDTSDVRIAAGFLSKGAE